MNPKRAHAALYYLNGSRLEDIQMKVSMPDVSIDEKMQEVRHSAFSISHL